MELANIRLKKRKKELEDQKLNLYMSIKVKTFENETLS